MFLKLIGLWFGILGMGWLFYECYGKIGIGEIVIC